MPEYYSRHRLQPLVFLPQNPARLKKGFPDGRIERRLKQRQYFVPDPVPPEFEDAVRQYYEQLGREQQ